MNPNLLKALHHFGKYQMVTEALRQNGDVTGPASIGDGIAMRHYLAAYHAA